MRLEESVGARLAEWPQFALAERIWKKDPTAWFDPPRPEIADRRGWLDLPAEVTAELAALQSLAVDAASFSHWPSTSTCLPPMKPTPLWGGYGSRV